MADVPRIRDIRAFNSALVDEFRANEGKVSGPFADYDMLLLTTTGAKSGEPRLTPLAFVTIDGKMLIVGSFGGAATDPAWVHNLRANPRAHIEVGSDAYDVTARELPPAERDVAFEKVVAAAPVSGEYQSKTSRVIPLFELQKA
ncbi:MAG: nitroreductase family deazaflavin-dependent oxidoreductase [Mycobacterium sp.]